MNAPGRMITRLGILAWVLLPGSVLAPWILVEPGGGFAAAAAAAMVFLLIVGVAFVLALYLFLRSVRQLDDLSLASRVAGLTPLPATLVHLMIVWYLAVG